MFACSNVMYFLGFYNSDFDHTSLTLSTLESVLEQALALIYWRGQSVLFAPRHLSLVF